MAYKPASDRVLFFTVGFLTIFGLVMVYSASMSSFAFLKQLLYAGIGFILLLFVMNVDYHFWQKPKVIYSLLAISAVTLLFVLTQATVNGSHRWIRHGILSFQPSEIAKLIVLIFVAAYLHQHEGEINQPRRGLFPIGAVLLAFAGLIVKEPDYGQALTICMIAGILLFIAGLSWKNMAGITAVAIPAICILLTMHPYHLTRLKAFIDPSVDPLKSGWQINQSLTAIGTGGISGLGLGASRQKLSFLPEAPSDFIFAVIGEEIGLIGTCIVAMAFLIVFYRGIRIALRSPDRFGFYLALGVTLMVVLQGFINMSMVLSMMPTKGIALPFMSQGGSSMLLNLIATGILLNLSHHNKLSEMAD
jgi:cell division protein FtsW